MADRNLPAADHICFLGRAYDHYQPAAIRHLLLRQEFYTSYTPSTGGQPGTLQGIFEFQSLVCRMTDLDIANSSMYDGAAAAAEALLMACRAQTQPYYCGRHCSPAYPGDHRYLSAAQRQRG